MGTNALVCVLGLVLLAACAAPSPPADEAATGQAPSLENGSFTAEVEGRRIHYEVHGSGPVVMVVPNSWGLSVAGLRAVFGALESRATMVYFDPRGMGGSAPVEVDADMGMEAVREDFMALQRHLGLDEVHAIGWSNGAMNLILLAAEHPEALSSAVFVHGAAAFTAEDAAAFAAGNPELVERWGTFERELAEPDLTEAERTARMKAFWLDEYFPRAMAAPEASAPSVKRAFEPAQFSHRHGRYTQTTYPLFDVRERLAEIPVRSLVIAGVADMMRLERVRELADGLPDGTLVVFEGSGHFAPLEEPERFQRVVFEFWGVGEPE